MTDEEDSRIEVRVKPGADERAVNLSNKLDSMLNSPMFERMVLQVVEEMILEGKLEYDPVRDLLDTPENIVMNWAAKRERRWFREAEKRWERKGK